METLSYHSHSFPYFHSSDAYEIALGLDGNKKSTISRKRGATPNVVSGVRDVLSCDKNRWVDWRDEQAHDSYIHVIPRLLTYSDQYNLYEQ